MTITTLEELQKSLTQLGIVEKELSSKEKEKEDIRKQIETWLEQSHLGELEIPSTDGQLWRMEIEKFSRRSTNYDKLEKLLTSEQYKDVVSETPIKSLRCQPVKKPRKKKTKIIQQPGWESFPSNKGEIIMIFDRMCDIIEGFPPYQTFINFLKHCPIFKFEGDPAIRLNDKKHFNEENEKNFKLPALQVAIEDQISCILIIDHGENILTGLDNERIFVSCRPLFNLTEREELLGYGKTRDRLKSKGDMPDDTAIIVAGTINKIETRVGNRYLAHGGTKEILLFSDKKKGYINATEMLEFYQTEDI